MLVYVLSVCCQQVLSVHSFYCMCANDNVDDVYAKYNSHWLHNAYKFVLSNGAYKSCQLPCCLQKLAIPILHTKVNNFNSAYKRYQSQQYIKKLSIATVHTKLSSAIVWTKAVIYIQKFPFVMVPMDVFDCIGTYKKCQLKYLIQKLAIAINHKCAYKSCQR